MQASRCVGAERCTVPAFTGVQFIPRVSRRGQAGRRRGGPWPARGPAGSSPASSDCLRPPAHASLGDHELAHAQPTAPACASLQPLGAPRPIPPLHHELATAHGWDGWPVFYTPSHRPMMAGWLFPTPFFMRSCRRSTSRAASRHQRPSGSAAGRKRCPRTWWRVTTTVQHQAPATGSNILTTYAPRIVASFP